MQGKLIVKCDQCDRTLAIVRFDTANDFPAWRDRDNYILNTLLTHRDSCPYYSETLSTWRRITAWWRP